MSLDSKLLELKKYFGEEELKRLNKRIYDLNLSEKVLKSFSQEKLQYIHVKLHNALSYKKPFALIDNIKKVHDTLVKFLKNHTKIDKLDEIDRKI